MFEMDTEPVVFDEEESFSRASAGSVSISCHGPNDVLDPPDLMEDSASRNLGRNGRC